MAFDIGPIGRLTEAQPVGFRTLVRQASRFPEHQQIFRQLQQARRTAQERTMQMHSAWSQETPSTPQSVPGKGYNDSPVGYTAGSVGGKTVRIGGPAQEGPPPSGYGAASMS
jgi:hypothetical protein